MRQFKSTYILLIGLMILSACKITKHVPEGERWLKKNKVEVVGDGLGEEDLEEIIKQKANYKSIGIRWKLRAYNLVRAEKVKKIRIQKNEKLDKINQRRKKREKRINQRRIERARENGDTYYKRKEIPLKDTLNPKLFFREWLKYKFGEEPVVFDSSYFYKSIEQMEKFLVRKGYYEGKVTGEVKPLIYKNRVKVKYFIELGPRFFIDSVYTLGPNARVNNAYPVYVERGDLKSLKGQPFDREMLDDYRVTVAKHYRDESYYGFSPTNISYVVDTNQVARTATIGLHFKDRVKFNESNKDSVIRIPQQVTYVRNVYFHIEDTSYYDGNFAATLQEMGLGVYSPANPQLIDTTRYAEIEENGELDPTRQVTFYHNGELFVDPAVLECQNYLEESGRYKEYYIDRTYSSLLQLGLFNTIKPVIDEVPDTNLIDVHYYLSPSKKQNFQVEPKATNSNGFLGVSASIDYTNKNLFGGAQRLTVSFSGGFESQPPVFDPNVEDQLLEQATRSFNTLEFGPSFELDVPGLLPTPIVALSKRHRPRTVISAGINYQKRTEFTRNTFQANYLYKMFVGKTQIFQYGLPFLSVIKYVNIQKTQAFDDQINQFNDLFLRNAYSDQLIWQDWKFSFEYNNQDKDNPTTQLLTYYKASFDPAGNILAAFQGVQDTTETGRYTLFNVPYSRFVRLDNDYIVSRKMSKKTSLHLRALAGAGRPTGNKETSLPFDYSFFAGGSNDNRGWRARSLGPGGYKYILDTTRTLTQIGDIRMALSLEYRFSLSNSLKMAVFTDAGNIWTMKEDVNRPGSQFSANWINEIAYSAGVGFRLDLDFFIIRLDLGFKLNNHTLPKGSRWFYQPRDAFEQELINTFGAEDLERLRSENKIPNPFSPAFHFGIGYPF